MVKISRKMKIPDKYLCSSKNDIKYLKRALRDKKLSGTSAIVEEYERELASFWNSEYAIAVSSGTAAIQCALFAVEVKEGDEVIVPPTAPSMTVFPILFINAKPVFCDTYSSNFGLNLEVLESCMSSRTKAVIEVPMWGYPTNVKELKEFLEAKGIPLILDLSQAHGTRLSGRYFSEYGDISCFSAHDNKILSTGEGGFILTNSKQLYDRMNGFRQYGFMDGEHFGLNYKISSLQAAIGLSRLQLVSKQIEIRTRNAKYILNRITNEKAREFPIIENGTPDYYSLLLQLQFKDNTAFIKYLEERGIPSDVTKYNYTVLYDYPLFKQYKRPCKNAERLVKSFTTIPVHPGLRRSELDYIVKVINEYKEK